MPFTISGSKKSSGLEFKAATEPMRDLQLRTDVHDAGGRSSNAFDVTYGGREVESSASDRGQQTATGEMVGLSRVLPTAGGEGDMTRDEALDIHFDTDDTVENRLRWATKAWAGFTRPQDRTNARQPSTGTTQTAVSKGKEPAPPTSFLGSLGTAQTAGSIDDVLYRSLRRGTPSPSVLAMSRDDALDIHFNTEDTAENRLC